MQQPSLNVAPLLRPLLQGITDYESGCRAKLHSQVTHSCHAIPLSGLCTAAPITLAYIHPCQTCTLAVLSPCPTPSPHTPTIPVPLQYCTPATHAPFPYFFLACTIPLQYLYLSCSVSVYLLSQTAHCRALATHHTSVVCHLCCCIRLTWKQGSSSSCLTCVFYLSRRPTCYVTLLHDDTQKPISCKGASIA